MGIAQGILRWSVSSQKVRLIIMKRDSNASPKEEKFLSVKQKKIYFDTPHKKHKFIACWGRPCFDYKFSSPQ